MSVKIASRMRKLGSGFPCPKGASLVMSRRWLSERSSGVRMVSMVISFSSISSVMMESAYFCKVSMSSGILEVSMVSPPACLWPQALRRRGATVSWWSISTMLKYSGALREPLEVPVSRLS